MRIVSHSLVRILAAAAAVAAVVTIVSYRLAPDVSPNPSFVVLNVPRGADPPRLGAQVVEARVAMRRSQGPRDPNDAFPENEERIVYEFTMQGAATVTMYGISANDRAQPLRLDVNGSPVRRTAFFESTGSTSGAYGRHLITTRLRLHPGTNTIELEGSGLSNRPLILELRAELPATLVGHARRFLPAFGGVVLIALIVSVRPRSARGQLALLALTFSAALLVPLVSAWMLFGDDLVLLGYKHPVLEQRNQAFEGYLADKRHAERRSTYEVAVFGDSTHYYQLPEESQLLPMLRSWRSQIPGLDIDFYGMSAGGMSAWDYYMLLNRVCDERPDLLILPVNGSSFSTAWMENRGYQFPSLQRYLRLAEYPGALSLSIRGRDLSLEELARQRVDVLLFDGLASPFLRGLKILWEEESQLLFERLSEALMPGREPVSMALATSDDDADWGARDIRADHDLMAVYARIASLASLCGIELLYYNVQEQPIELGGTGPVTSPVDMQRILALLAQDEGVHTLYLDARYGGEMFNDAWIHLTPKGMKAVSRLIFDETLGIMERAPNR